ncbi:nitrophenyl compound nitroreductase subunit ArsF family protein [Candidatus Latescibacterota bacterium]
MNVRKIITVVLFLFVAASIGTLAVRQLNPIPVSQPTADAPAVQASSPAETAAARDEYRVYYFMTSQRCVNCINFELFTKEVLDTSFSDKTRDKQLIWEMVNLDEPQNRHYIQDYQLFTKSIVLVHFKSGIRTGWKNLGQIWNLVGDKDAFQSYIESELTSFVGAQG